MAFHSFSDNRSWTFDQAVAMRAQTNACNAAHHGSCHNFSLEWLHMVLDKRASGGRGAVGKDKQARAKHMKKDTTVKNSIVTQTAFAKAWGQTNYQGADTMMAQLRHLEMKTVIEYGAFRPATLTKMLRDASRAGFVYSFWWSNGGHSIAFYRSAAHLFVFDPNLGEFEVAPKNIITWFDKFKRHYEQYFAQITHHAMKSGVIKKYSLGGGI